MFGLASLLVSYRQWYALSSKCLQRNKNKSATKGLAFMKQVIYPVFITLFIDDDDDDDDLFII